MGPWSLFILLLALSSISAEEETQSTAVDNSNRKGKFFGGIIFDIVHDTVDFAEQTMDAMDELMNPHLPQRRKDHDDDIEILGDFPDRRPPHRPFRPLTSNVEGITDFFFFPFSSSRSSWWNGPNVCVDEEEEEDNTTIRFPGVVQSFTYQSCSMDAIDRRSCINKKLINGTATIVKTTYRCCHGFKRINLRVTGCVEANLVDVMETLPHVRAGMFARLCESRGLGDQLRNHNVTVFAPNDAAIQEFTEELEEENNLMSEIEDLRRRRRELVDGLRDVIAAHVTDGFIRADEISDNTLLTTTGGSKIRVNVYSHGSVVTANCARVISANHEATNGIVHVIDDVMKPVQQTVAEILESDPQFSELKDRIDTSLGEDGPYTVFAPTNDAFSALPPSVLEALSNAGQCLDNLWKNHVVPGTLCSPAVAQSAEGTNILGRKLSIHRDPINDALIVEGATVVTKDIVATDGVIHAIDQVLIPTEALSLLPAVSRDPDLTHITDLLERAGFADDLSNLNNVTLLAPTNEAFDRLPIEQQRLLEEDSEILREVLTYHLVEGKVSPASIAGRESVTSLLQDREIHINTFRPDIDPISSIFFPQKRRVFKALAQCAPLVGDGQSVCNGRFVKVSEVLLPPEESIADIIEGNEEFSIVRGLLQLTGMKDLLASAKPLTFLAPPDEAFNHLQVGSLRKLQSDEQLAERVIKHLIVEDVVCCTSATRGLIWGPEMYRSMLGDVISFRRDRHDRVRVENAQVKRCDNMATNGVMHVIDRVLLPHDIQIRGGDILERLFSILDPLPMH